MKQWLWEQNSGGGAKTDIKIDAALMQYLEEQKLMYSMIILDEQNIELLNKKEDPTGLGLGTNQVDQTNARSHTPVFISNSSISFIMGFFLHLF